MSELNDMLNSHHPKRHARRFYHAFKGLEHVFRNEANFRIHVVAAVTASLLASYLNFSTTEWLVLVLTMGFVLITEILNTLIEEMIDHLITEHHEAARIIKDVGAASVLMAAIISVVSGALLFIPKLF
ncbi:MAG: diacylglycerol kinase family protein [Patescibacteria group bacterium]